MKRVLIVVTALVLSGLICACNNKGSSQPTATAKVEQKSIVPAQMKDSELAVAFLVAVQNNDKKMMYEISSLTPEMVNESREILTHAAKYKQSKKERAETEHALRMSGNIDFYLKKLTKIFPQSALLQVTKTTQESRADGSINVHLIKVSFSNKEDALGDKVGKRIKEMVVRLHQIKHVVNGNTLQEFVFDSKDFEKMSDKEFEVLSYY